MKSAVLSMGSSARTHIGIIAQELKKVFEDEGLSPFDYGILCYDEWEAQPSLLDEDGVEITPEIPSGSMYSVRYDELFAFIIAAL